MRRLRASTPARLITAASSSRQRTGVVRRHQLLALPVGLRAGRRVAPVPVRLPVDLRPVGGAPHPHPPHEHAGSVPPASRYASDRVADPLRCRQRVEEQADVQACGPAHRTDAHGRAEHGHGIERAPGDGGVAAEQSRVGPAQCPGHGGQAVGEARREVVLGEPHDVEVGVEGARRQAEPDAPGKACRQPRHLLGDQGGRSQRAAGAGTAPPTPRAWPRAATPPPAGDWACNRRTRRGARSSSPRRTPLRCRARAWSRSSRTISGAESPSCG